jgi:hypothetical protein
MNKNVLVIPLVLIAATILVVPVMAEPTKGLKVPASLIPGPLVFQGEPEKEWVTEGGVWQARGVQNDYYPLTLTIGSDVYTDGYSYNYVNSVFDFKTMSLNTRGAAVWTFGSIGRFEGNLEMKVSYIDFCYSIHGVLFGFGDFEGQMLMLSYDGPLVGAVWTGYCLKA